MSAPKYLPIIVAVLTLASLAGACTLSVVEPAQAQKAWEAFLGFSAYLIGVHTPGPGGQ